MQEDKNKNNREEFDMDEEFISLKNSLKQQVNEELDKVEKQGKNNKSGKKKGRTRTKKFLKGVFITFSVLLLVLVLLVGTKSGRSIIVKLAVSFMYNSLDTENGINGNSDITQRDNTDINDGTSGQGENQADIKGRQEKYVTNYLLFGIEEIGGARNTDSMIIASVNTKDDTIKLTSLLRDTYVEIPGHNPNKLNAVYANGGAELLIDTIEQNYLIHIDGYASIDFKSFEKIVDLLGGISIELGEKEAHYLNTTNYISNKAYRNVKPGVNILNGNQALGYCRVRKVATLGGANNDYGRTLRQRRALQAIFNKYKSTSIFKLLPIMSDCLGYVTTNVTKSQTEKVLQNIVENKIKTMDNLRIPIDGAFDDPRKYNGVTDPLVIDWDVNRKELYKFIFLDTDKEAEEAIATVSSGQ